MTKPEPTDADRERALKLCNTDCLHDEFPYAHGGECHLCQAAELAAVREEGFRQGYREGIEQGIFDRQMEKQDLLSPGPCGKHPKACAIPITVEYRDGIIEDAEECSVCEAERKREKPLVEALEKLPKGTMRASRRSGGPILEIINDEGSVGVLAFLDLIQWGDAKALADVVNVGRAALKAVEGK